MRVHLCLGRAGSVQVHFTASFLMFVSFGEADGAVTPISPYNGQTLLSANSCCLRIAEIAQIPQVDRGCFVLRASWRVER